MQESWFVPTALHFTRSTKISGKQQRWASPATNPAQLGKILGELWYVNSSGIPRLNNLLKLSHFDTIHLETKNVLSIMKSVKRLCWSFCVHVHVHVTHYSYNQDGYEYGVLCFKTHTPGTVQNQSASQIHTEPCKSAPTALWHQCTHTNLNCKNSS